MAIAPLLVLAVGNPSRGDDGLGPALLERLRAAGVERAGEVELLEDFQLQIEHALDLQGRRAVLFVDAAQPGALTAAVSLEAIVAAASVPAASHSLRPQAVLRVAEQLYRDIPPAWLLGIAGERFGLGEGLSHSAECHLTEAVGIASRWLRQHGAMEPADA